MFYGSSPEELTDPARLPAALEADIRRYREETLRFTQPVQGGYRHAFTKAHRGRSLCLEIRSNPKGIHTLSLYEDQSKHADLRRIIAACRLLDRDRGPVFTTCLILAEGWHDTDDIMKRAGLTKLKRSAALKIINPAKNIMGGLRSAP